MTDAVRARSADTSADAERVQVELLRRVSVARRLHMAFRLSATVMSMARRALARQRPHASRRELDLEFVALHYGAALADGLRVELDRRDRAPSSNV